LPDGHENFDERREPRAAGNEEQDPGNREQVMRVTGVVRVCVVWAAMLVTGFSVMPAAVSAADEPIRVYCTGVTQSGFIAPAVADSVNDTIKMLKTKKALLVVDSRETAEIVVTVTARGAEGTGQRDFTTRSTTSGSGTRRTTSTSRERTTNVLQATMQVGKFKQALVGNGGFWSAAASDIAEQVDKWAKANAAQIRAQNK
jgi:hypothetical protein